MYGMTHRTFKFTIHTIMTLHNDIKIKCIDLMISLWNVIFYFGNMGNWTYGWSSVKNSLSFLLSKLKRYSEKSLFVHFHIYQKANKMIVFSSENYQFQIEKKTSLVVLVCLPNKNILRRSYYQQQIFGGDEVW